MGVHNSSTQVLAAQCTDPGESLTRNIVLDEKALQTLAIRSCEAHTARKPNYTPQFVVRSAGMGVVDSDEALGIRQTSSWMSWKEQRRFWRRLPSILLPDVLEILSGSRTPSTCSVKKCFEAVKLSSLRTMARSAVRHAISICPSELHVLQAGTGAPECAAGAMLLGEQHQYPLNSMHVRRP
jgi:hypothetical protein